MYRRVESAPLRGAKCFVPLVVCVALGWAGSAAGAEQQTATISLDGDPHAGFVTVSWAAPGEIVGSAEVVEFQLEEGRDEAFANRRLRYQGTQTSSVISGLRDGKYFYRARYRVDDHPWSDWSPASEFDVEHHSIRLAGSLFGVGGVVFAAILIFLWRVKT